MPHLEEFEKMPRMIQLIVKRRRNWARPKWEIRLYTPLHELCNMDGRSCSPMRLPSGAPGAEYPTTVNLVLVRHRTLGISISTQIMYQHRVRRQK